MQRDALNAPAPTPGIPAGLEPVEAGGPFMGVNGPLYMRQQDGAVRLGLRHFRAGPALPVIGGRAARCNGPGGLQHPALVNERRG